MNMKKTYHNLATLLIAALALVHPAYAQSNLPSKMATATANPNDILYVVINPGTTPADRKITVSNLFQSRNGNKNIAEYASLSAAQTAIGTSTQAVVEIPSTTTVSASLTITPNIELLPTGPGLISVASGQTLTIQSGTSRWPIRQIFTGAGNVRLYGPGTGIFPQWFGASGDGVTNDASALNAALASSSTSGLPVMLGGLTFGLSSALDGSISNVSFISPRGGAILKVLGSNHILNNTSGYHNGWRFENIEFQGDLYLYDSRDVNFIRCKFRGPADAYAVVMYGARNVRFFEPEFYGTRSGVMASGVQDPTAVPSAKYAYGVKLVEGVSDVEFTRPKFHFCINGIGADSTTTQAMHGLRVFGGSFRGDWWNSPYVIKRITPTAYNTTTSRLTASGGGFTGLFGSQDHHILSIPIQIATGTGFSDLSVGDVTISGGGFANAKKGDSIETSNGKRAEILSKVDSNHVTILGWEDVSTFEPAVIPALATSWRLTRYYAAGGTFVDDQNIDLYWYPICPFDGDRLIEAGLTPVGKSCRVLSTLIYSGMHLNGGVSDFQVSGATFRGCRADCVSVFDSEAPKVIGNTFEYYFDEGITLTRSPRFIVHDNTFDQCGVSAIFFGDSDEGSIRGNKVNNWGLVNQAGLGMIDGAAKRVLISGNSGKVPSGVYGTGAKRLITLGYGLSSEDSIIEGNIDGGARVATLNVDAETGPITARDVYSIEGAGRDNVRVGVNEPWTLKTGLVEHWSLDDERGSHYGMSLTNHGGVTFAAGKVGNGAVFSSGKWLSIADNPLVSIGLGVEFEINLWVKVNTLADANIITKASGGAANYEYVLDYNASANRFVWSVGNGTTLASVGANTFGALSTGTWYFVRVGWDKLNSVAWISINNGARDTVAHTGGAWNGANDLGIGASAGGGSVLDGMIDEVNLYKVRKLNSDDSTKTYNGGSGLAWPLM